MPSGGPTVSTSTRRIWSIEGNRQRLDGGAMFGNAPRALWERWTSVDDAHRIPLACRALLVVEEGRRVLFEAGIGAFFPPELRERYGVVEPGHVLLDNLAEVGFAPDDVDVVVLSHLHFDHAGGVLTAYREGAAPGLAFPRARYVVGEAALRRAQSPHLRDRASFVPELPGLLLATGRVEVVTGPASAVLGDGYVLRTSHGHTPGLLVTEIESGAGPVVFCADMIPGAAWAHLPITMGYDRCPETLVDEKAALLTDLVGRGGRLFFTHDPEVALARVVRDDRGRFGVADPAPRVNGLAL
jgi:glyoxylase-like metal-dependent hydrolase (beta-lactamase superfamily II)